MFKRVWTPAIGEILAVNRQPANTEDQFIVIKDGTVVGYVSHESQSC